MGHEKWPHFEIIGDSGFESIYILSGFSAQQSFVVKIIFRYVSLYLEINFIRMYI